jgi:Zn-finger nucleic acid-binding protein
MRCVMCDADLAALDLGGAGLVAVQRCPQCGGTWFDPGALHQLEEDLFSDAVQVAFEKTRRLRPLDCPTCRVGMQSFAPRDLKRMIVDCCPSCRGFWIGKKELEHSSARADDEQSMVVERKSVGGRPAQWSKLRWVAFRLRRCFE